MPEIQLLRDPNIQPTPDVIAACLGVTNAAYTSFVAGLQAHDIQVSWRYYTDGNAWLAKGLYKWTTSRGTAKEITAFWLSIWEGFARITFYIPEKARIDALTLPLADDIKQMIVDGKQMGKLKFFPVTFDLHSDKWHEDLYRLADFRKAIK